jgi:putative membrane protein
MMWGYGFAWPGMVLMMLSGLLWLAVIGVAIWALVRWASRDATMRGQPGATPGREPSAMETLRQRYARGEIDTATFEDMRARLEATREGTREATWAPTGEPTHASTDERQPV